MGDGQGASTHAEPWVSCWLCLRQPAAGTDDAGRPPAAFRSPSRSPAIVLAVGFRVLSRSPTPVPGLPAPEQAESGSLPADESLGLENHQRSSPMRPDFHEQQPEVTVRPMKLRPGRPAFEDGDLVSEGEILQGEIMLGTEPAQQVAQEC